MPENHLAASFQSIIAEHPNEGVSADLLRQLCLLCGIEQLSYLALGDAHLKDGAADDLAVFTVSTYPDRWQERYVSQKYYRRDPVVACALDGILPLDWADVPRDQPSTCDFFDEAYRLGVAKNGLSSPVRGRGGEQALVSVNSSLSDDAFLAFKSAMIADLTYFSFLLHEHVLGQKKDMIRVVPPRLSPREIEVISWAAEGKTAWETGKIINLSERTVNFYFQNAAEKLGAASKAQTLAKAFRAQILR